MAVLTTQRGNIHHGISRSIAIPLRSVVVALTLATAEIHRSLGGSLFLANATVYAVLALAMILPGPFGRIRWLTRTALAGVAAATIGGWLMFGARFDLAYLDKAIEVVLIGSLGVEAWLFDGGPVGIARRAYRAATGLLAHH